MSAAALGPIMTRNSSSCASQVRHLIVLGNRRGLRIAREGFVDRAYNADGTLASRRLPRTVYEDVDTAVNQAVRMVTDGTVVAIDGTVIEIGVDTLCTHGDGAHAVELVKALRNGLLAAGVELRNINEIIGSRARPAPRDAAPSQPTTATRAAG